MAEEIITRAEARAQGLRRYFTGEPCKNGHISERLTSSSSCLRCCYQWRVDNRDRHLKNQRAQYARSGSNHRIVKLRIESLWASSPVECDDPNGHSEAFSRRDAIVKGLVHYFTGKPCRAGHIAKRNTKGGNCVECQNEWRADNIEQMRAFRSAWAKRNPDKARMAWKRWAERNPERDRKSRRRWAAANKDRVLECGRRYAKRHPLKNNVKCNRRRARISEALGRHTHDDLLSIFKLQKGKCAYCSADLRKGKHIDHIRPLSKGGSNDRSNLQYLCVSCNVRKGARDPIEFAQQMGRLL